MLLCNKLPTCPLYKLIFLPKILFCQNHTCIRISKTASHELYFCHNCSWKKYTCHVLDKSEFSQMFSPLRFHLFFSKGCLLKLILSATLSTCPMCRSVLYPKILFCKNCSWHRFTNLNFHKFSLFERIKAINYCSSKQAKQLSRNIKKSPYLIFSSLNLTIYNYQHKGCLFKMLLCNKLPICPLCQYIFHPKILFCQNHTCKCILKTASYEQYKLWIRNHKRHPTSGA